MTEQPPLRKAIDFVKENVVPPALNVALAPLALMARIQTANAPVKTIQ